MDLTNPPFSPRRAEIVLAGLKAIKAGKRDPDFGLCTALNDYFETLPEAAVVVEADDEEVFGFDGYDTLEMLAEGWPEHSGHTSYPVPAPPRAEGAHPRESEPKWAYDNLSHWSANHPYGAARYRLLDWCIAKVEGFLTTGGAA